MKKRIAILAIAATILTGCTAMPAFAYTEQNTNPGETIVIGQDVPDASESEENTESNESAQAESQDAASENTEASNEESADEPVIDRTDAEPVDPLTPNGNMTLVDDVSVSTGTKQFLTLTTRNGNFYYLIIDRDKDGNENVHFLNQVDERDLISLMDEDEAKGLEEQLARQKEEEEAAQAALSGPTEEPEPIPEPEPEPEKVINIGGFEISQKIFTALIGCGLIIIIAVVMLVKFGKKKKPEENKPDPDADYEEDLGDEMEFEQGEFEDEDFDE